MTKDKEKQQAGDVSDQALTAFMLSEYEGSKDGLTIYMDRANKALERYVAIVSISVGAVLVLQQIRGSQNHGMFRALPGR